MLSPDCTFDQLDPRHWANAWRLALPPRVLARPRWALGVVTGAPPRLVHVVVAGDGARGRVDPATAPLRELTPEAIAAWASGLGVGAAVVVDRELLTTLSADIEPLFSLGHDLPEQGVLAWRALRRHLGRGVWTEPNLLPLLPAPAYEALDRTFDRLIPDRSSIVAYVIEDDRRRVHSSLVAHKRGGDLVHVTSHAALDDKVDEAAFARAWDTRYRAVLDAAAERIAKPSIGLFLEHATLRRILTGPSDTLARELTAKHVIIDPAPTWLAGLLGGAQLAAVATRGARALAAFLPAVVRERAADLADRARDAARDAGADPFALLGFDPFALWAELKHLYRE